MSIAREGNGASILAAPEDEMIHSRSVHFWKPMFLHIWATKGVYIFA